MNKKIHLVSLVFSMLLVLVATKGSVMVINQPNTGNVELRTDHLVVQVVGGGNIPSYTFWDPAHNFTKYKISFNAIFEAEDNTYNGTQGVYDKGIDTRDSKSKIQLQKLTWEFSDIVNETNGDVNFNITSTPTSGGAMISFHNHLYANQDNAIKFDFALSGYTFHSNTSLLVLEFGIIQQGGDPFTVHQSGGIISFGNGFFQSASTATAGDSSVKAGLSIASDSGSKIYVAYGNFNGSDLLHDPTMGVQAAAATQTDPNSGSVSSSQTDGSTGSTSTDDNSSPTQPSEETLALFNESVSNGASFTTIFATTVMLLVPLVLLKQKK